MIQKFDPINNKHIHILIISNAIITVISVLVCLFVMYQISLTENENRLKELAQSQARIIESVSEFDLKTMRDYLDSSKAKAWENTLSQIRAAHENYKGFGKTGEFTLGKKEGNRIIFLLSHRHFDLDSPKPIHLNSKFAEPMKAALFFNSGVMTGLDYRGEMVLAAYEPVKTHVGNLGIVAKIDLSEIREPFLVTGMIILATAVLIIAWVSWMFFRTLSPIVKRQEESILALQHSEALLSKSQEIANIGSWDWNIKENTAQWSDSMFMIHGISKTNGVPFPHGSWEVNVHPDDLMDLKAAVNKAFETKKLDIKYRVIKGVNEVSYVHSVGELEEDKNGNPIRMIGVLRDTTDEVLVRGKVIRQENFLKKIYDNTPSLIIVMDEKGVLTQVNRYAELLIGYGSDELLGKDCFDTIVPNDYQENARDILESIISAERKNEEILIPIISKNKVIHTIGWRTSLYDYENKKYILAVGLDKTESIHLETKYQDLYGSMRDGFAAIDLDGNIIEVNSAFCEMLKYNEEELLNMNFLNITPKKWHQFEKDITSSLSGKFDCTQLYEKEYICKDDSLLPVELRVCTLMNNTVDKVIGYWALIRDISERKKTEQELHKQEEMIISQSRQVAMGDMIAMIAHQWRQPITTVTMVANNILMDLSFDDVSVDSLKEDMNKIISQTNYLSNTIDDFRNFFNPKNKKMDVSLGKVLNDTISIIGKSFENNKIDIKIDILDDQKIKVYEKELLQVLLIILNNAKDSIISNNIDNGLVKIEIGTTEKHSFIKVTDNGGGIPENIIKRLGEPYLTTKAKHGTGLGLYMSNIIVKKHMDGHLKWYNKVNGACIEVMIPKDEKENVE